MLTTIEAITIYKIWQKKEPPLELLVDKQDEKEKKRSQQILKRQSCYPPHNHLHSGN